MFKINNVSVWGVTCAFPPGMTLNATIVNELRAWDSDGDRHPFRTEKQQSQKSNATNCMLGWHSESVQWAAVVNKITDTKRSSWESCKQGTFWKVRFLLHISYWVPPKGILNARQWNSLRSTSVIMPHFFKEKKKEAKTESCLFLKWSSGQMQVLLLVI